LKINCSQAWSHAKAKAQSQWLAFWHAQGQPALQEALAWLGEHPKQVRIGGAAVLTLAGSFAFAVASVANFGPDIALQPVHQVESALELPQLAEQIKALDQAPHFNLYRSDISRSGDNADALLRRLGVSDVQAAAFLRTDRLVQKTLLGRAGRNLIAEASDDQRLVKLTARWGVDEGGTDNKGGQFLRLVIEKTAEGRFTSRLDSAPLTANQAIASGTIKSNLFAATDAARIPDSVATQLAEIFSGDIDFQRSLQKGDRFSVVYETLEADGEVIKSGRVLSAEFVNRGKTHQSVWFQDPTQPNQKGGYFTLDGKSLRHAFLASPVPFSRVTSGFQMRFHPILQTWKAHLGTDFGAPTGTPVRCVGDGTVDFAGVQNGYGNVVMVKHSGGQMTVYAHLSQMAVRKGQSVAQGQNLGAVGSTGWATGPHLHFEFRVNGQHKDPLTIARASESVPLSPEARPYFNKLAGVTRQQLAQVASNTLPPPLD